MDLSESESEVAQSCQTLCDPVDCSPPGSSVHGIFQVRVLEWVAISFSRGSSQPRDQTQVSRIVGRRFTIWATREVRMDLRWAQIRLASYMKLLLLSWFVVSNSVWYHRWQPTRLLCPWDSPGKNTGVGCHFLLQSIKVKSEKWKWSRLVVFDSWWPHGL